MNRARNKIILTSIVAGLHHTKIESELPFESVDIIVNVKAVLFERRVLRVNRVDGDPRAGGNILAPVPSPAWRHRRRPVYHSGARLELPGVSVGESDILLCTFERRHGLVIDIENPSPIIGTL